MQENKLFLYVAQPHPCNFCCCLLFISTSIWVLRTPNAGQNLHFNIFHAKNLKKNAKKQQICSKVLQKKTGFLILHQNDGRVFYSQKKKYLYLSS